MSKSDKTPLSGAVPENAIIEEFQRDMERDHERRQRHLTLLEKSVLSFRPFTQEHQDLLDDIQKTKARKLPDVRMLFEPKPQSIPPRNLSRELK